MQYSVVWLLCHQRKTEKKKSLDTVLWMAVCSCGSPATAVSLLLLEVLFMQISGLSLTLTWPCRLCLLRVLLGMVHCYKLSPFQAHWGRWHCTSFLRPACLFTVHMGYGSSPSPVEFSSHCHFYKLSCSWLLGMCHRSWLLRQLVGDFPSPTFGTQGTPPSLVHVFLLVLLIIQFLFFPWVGVSLSRGLCWCGPGLWE
jgi:hypothetical protein